MPSEMGPGLLVRSLPRFPLPPLAPLRGLSANLPPSPHHPACPWGSAGEGKKDSPHLSHRHRFLFTTIHGRSPASLFHLFAVSDPAVGTPGGRRVILRLIAPALGALPLQLLAISPVLSVCLSFRKAFSPVLQSPIALPNTYAMLIARIVICLVIALSGYSIEGFFLDRVNKGAACSRQHWWNVRRTPESSGLHGALPTDRGADGKPLLNGKTRWELCLGNIFFREAGSASPSRKTISILRLGFNASENQFTSA